MRVCAHARVAVTIGVGGVDDGGGVGGGVLLTFMDRSDLCWCGRFAQSSISQYKTESRVLYSVDRYRGKRSTLRAIIYAGPGPGVRILTAVPQVEARLSVTSVSIDACVVLERPP